MSQYPTHTNVESAYNSNNFTTQAPGHELAPEYLTENRQFQKHKQLTVKSNLNSKPRIILFDQYNSDICVSRVRPPLKRIPAVIAMHCGRRDGK